MDLFTHTESKLHSKSSETKAQYAFFVAVFVTVIIGSVWASTLPARFAEFKISNPTYDEDKGEMVDLFQDTKTQVGNVVETVKETDLNEAFGSDMENLGQQEFVDDAQFEDTIVQDSYQQEEIIDAPLVEESSALQEIVPESNEPTMVLIGTTTSQKTE